MDIIRKEMLVDSQGMKIVKLTVKAPEIAAKARPGQFVVLMVAAEGERIPLTVVNADAQAGTIVVIAQVAGLTTTLLAAKEPGDRLYAIVGPLGHATEIRKYGKVILVGGGVGIAEIYPVAKAMKAAGNQVVSVIGARTKDFLILEQEMKEASSELAVVTDDGSYARKGFVTQALKELLEQGPCDLVYAVGPVPMMRAVSLVTKEYNVRTLVSLNALMVDATGMCGCCRVTVAGAVKFSCVDGPEFDAAQVDWDELMKRNSMYNDKEKHICQSCRLK